MKTLKQLKQDRRDFYSQIWLDYTALRKSLHKRITAEKSRLVTEQAKLESQFIAKAIKAAGTKELADKMILNDIYFDVSSWSHTTNNGKSGLHDFHAIAMLRNGWKPGDHPTFDMGVKRGDYKEYYLLIPERALGEDCPEPDGTKLKTLESALGSCTAFKDVLKGKSEDLCISHDRSPQGSQTRTMIEMKEYYEKVYPDKDPNDKMTIFEAMELMENMQNSPLNNKRNSSMSVNEMAEHVERQTGERQPREGEMVHFGANGREIVPII